MRVRQLAAAAAMITTAAVGLTACSSKVGAAAVVGDHRISDNNVNSYVKPGAQPFQTQNQSTGGTTTTIPRVEVLNELVYLDLFGRALQAHGGPLTSTEINADTPSASQLAQLDQQLAQEGFQPSFGSVVVRAQQQIDALEKRLKDDQSLTKTLAALTALKVNVQVSPRYGSWDNKNFGISSSPTDGLPTFVRLPGSKTSTAPST